MSKTFKDIIYLVVATISLTLLIWLPHLLALPNFYGLDFSAGFNTIYRNFDGLEYVIIAKSLYDPEIIKTLPQSQETYYYASHFPGYAITILFFAPILGFLKSMLFTSLLFTTASVIAFYFLVKDFKLSEKPLILSLIFLILPARWVIVHSVGSSEPMFIFAIIMSIYFFLKFEAHQKWLYIYSAGLFGLLAAITRPPGILLFIALAIYLFWKTLKNYPNNFIKEMLKTKLIYHPLALIPLGTILVFFWFSQSYGDFFAYFKTGDNIHLTFPPFQVFNKAQFWVGDIWLEDIIYIFLVGFLAGMYLLKQKLYPLAFFVFTYLVASILVVHRDVSRYLLPVFPFALIAFEKVLVSREFRIVLIILALAIYLYSQNFIIQNIAPFPNLEAFN